MTTSSAVVISLYTPNVAPTVSITSPVNNTTFASPASITISATAADADGSVSKWISIMALRYWVLIIQAHILLPGTMLQQEIIRLQQKLLIMVVL